MLIASSCSGKSTTTQSQDSDTAIESKQPKTTISIDEETGSEAQDNSVSRNNTDVSENIVKTTLVNNGKPSIIDFSAVWCPPCRKMKPIFEKIAKQYGDKINFISIDVDEYPEIANKYQIQSIPTFVFLDEDGKETNRINGAVPESELTDEIQNGAWY